MIFNKKILMSGVDYFSVEELNPYSDSTNQPNEELTRIEYGNLAKCFVEAGIEVVSVGSPLNCQDGVYTANWALCRNNKAIIANLPNIRAAETAYAIESLGSLGFEIIRVPSHLKFSGQGDALPCGNLLFAGYGYRTDLEVHEFLTDKLGYQVISLQTVPALDDNQQPIINKISGWADSFFYDIDLALSVIREDLIAWCPEAFMPSSQEIIAKLDIKKIEVDLDEAISGFACNLVSTGETVIMSAEAPKLAQALKEKGLKIIQPKITELAKGGGYIRCTSLSLDNK